jgi:hypothetical protein
MRSDVCSSTVQKKRKREGRREEKGKKTIASASKTMGSSVTNIKSIFIPRGGICA